MSQIEIINCKFELCCEVITRNVDQLVKWSGEVYSMHGGELYYYWYQDKSSQYPVKKERRKI